MIRTFNSESMRFVIGFLAMSTLLAALGVGTDIQANADRGDVTSSVPLQDAENRFDPRVVRPSKGSNEQQIRKALQSGDTVVAQLLLDIGFLHATEEVSGRLHWLATKTTRKSAQVLSHLKAIQYSSHPLSLWAGLKRAELVRKKNPQLAAQITKKLNLPWSGRKRAERIHALALLDMGRSDQAIPLLRKLVQQTPKKQSAVTIAIPLADCLAQRSDIDSRIEAIRLYFRVASRSPLSHMGTEAKGKAERLLSQMPVHLQKRLATPSIEDQFMEGEALLSARKYTEAQSLFAEIASRIKKTDPVAHCRARLKQGRALLLQRKRKEGAKLLSSIAHSCPDDDSRAWARFFAGRALLRINEPKAAIRQFKALESESATHSLADDALYKAAFAAKDANDEKGMIRRLLLIPKRYPKGDMKIRARFALVMTYRHHKRYYSALKQLDKLIADKEEEPTEGMRGRAHYWRARTLFDLGIKTEAIRVYRQIVQSGPLDYYAQQALARLSEIDPPVARELLQSIENHQTEIELTFERQHEMELPSFKRAVELLRVDEITLAKQELYFINAIGKGADRTMLWLAAAMFHHAGAFRDAIGLVRHRLPPSTQMVPTGQARAMWRIAYPRAFEPLIEDVAEQAEIPATFIRAVAREESGFDPDAVSIAHAYGLIQVIPATAHRYAKELGLPSDPASLKVPEINLHIGAHFIRYLWNRYAGNPSVVPSAYNAGQGALDRWIRAKPQQSLDTFIEDIPYFETQRYTRRVLQTYGVYSWLDSGKLPVLNPQLPLR